MKYSKSSIRNLFIISATLIAGAELASNYKEPILRLETHQGIFYARAIDAKFFKAGTARLSSSYSINGLDARLLKKPSKKQFLALAKKAA